MHKLTAPFILLISFLLTGCWIEEVDEPGNGGGGDSSSVFLDVSSSNLPLANLGNNSMDAKAADLDNDGDQDLVVAVEFNPNKILINDGDGVFTDESDTRLPARDYDSEDIAVADFDNNSTLDLVFVSEDNQTNEYYLNDGSGNFTNVSNRLPVTGTSNAVLAADINGDNFPDLLIGNNGQNVVLINDGQGFFSNQSPSRLPGINDITQDLALADIDGDGDLDLLSANEDDNRIMLNVGSGVFADRTRTRLPFRNDVEETREVDLADIDGDNDPDLYFSNVLLFQSGNNARDRLLTNTQGNFSDVTQSQLAPANTNSFDADFFDIDRDGDFDIVVGDFGTLDDNTGNYNGRNYTQVLINDGSGFFSDQTTDFLPEDFSPKVTDFEIADYNGDGLYDIYVANYRSPDVLLMQQD